MLHDEVTIILLVHDTHASVIVNFFERTGTQLPKSISVSVTVKLQAHHGIFIVVVAHAQLAVTHAPVKFRVVTVLDNVPHSSCVVIVVHPPHVAVSVHADNDSPLHTVISSTAQLEAVVRHRIRAVFIVTQSVVILHGAT